MLRRTTTIAWLPLSVVLLLLMLWTFRPTSFLPHVDATVFKIPAPVRLLRHRQRPISSIVRTSSSSSSSGTMSRLSSLQPQSIASSAFPSRNASPARPPPSQHRHHHHHHHHHHHPQHHHQLRNGSGAAREEDEVKTVLVLGGSYSGAHAADVLAKELPQRTQGRWRVILIERNSHFHHVYHFPRYAVVPGHAHKAFVPYTRLLSQHDPSPPPPTSDPASSPPASSSSRTSSEERQSEEGEVDDPDRYVETVSGLKASLQAANVASLLSSAASSSAPPPPKHLVVQASVTHIGRGYVDLDRPVAVPSIVASLAATEPVAATSSSESESEEAKGCGEEGCCSDARDCVERDSGYAGSLVDEKLGGLSLGERVERNGGGGDDPSRSEREGQETKQIKWDYLIYALGSHPPPPLQMPSLDSTSGLPWERSKRSGIGFLESQGRDIERAKRIVVIGGGALGIQYATDIASLYPSQKTITLVHSRQTFLPLYSPEIDQAVKQTLSDLGVQTVLGERVDMGFVKKEMQEWERKRGGVIRVRTLAGREIEADYVLLCTGQIPNSSLMAHFCPLSVPGGHAGGGAIKVLRSMQVAPSPLGPSPVSISVPSTTSTTTSRGMERSDTQETAVPIHRRDEEQGNGMEACDCATSPPVTAHKRLWDWEPASSSGSSSKSSDDDDDDASERDESEDPLWKRVFAVGDCADAFGAIKAGHTGWNQAEVAAKNVMRLIRWEEKGGKAEELEVEEEEGGEEGEGEGSLLRYEHRQPMMKLTLGLGHSISQLVSLEDPTKLEVSRHETGPPDSHWQHMWKSMGMAGDCDGWA